jgi:hypothetical protein
LERIPFRPVTGHTVAVPLVELDADILEATARRLRDRIAERFPDSGLCQRADDLIQIITQTRMRAVEISRPIWWVRALYPILGVLVIVGLAAVPINLPSAAGRDTLDWIQVLESAVNDLVLLGAGLVFVSTVETRLKRRRVLREIHEIRSFAHVIDMMQLTKDPQRLVGYDELATSSSPKATMNAFELGRYLDYCSELLALSAKGAALIAQRFDDPPVLAAVNEIEMLTSGLARKIWQKLMILMSTDPEAAPTSRMERPSV